MEDDLDSPTMQSPKNYKPIENLMYAESLVPKPGYGPTDVHQLQEDLGYTFSTILKDTFAVGVGLAHLVNPLDRLIECSSIDATLLDGTPNPDYVKIAKYMPTKPTYDVKVLTSSHKLFMYKIDLIWHNQCAHYQLEGFWTINCVLPGSLLTSIVPGTRDSYLVSTTIK